MKGNPNDITHSRRRLTFLLLIFIAALYATLSYLTPLAYDDWVFMAEWHNINGDEAPGLSTLYEFRQYIAEYDNGRLANVLSPLSTIFSPWKQLFPFATGICVALIILFTTVFSFGRNGIRPYFISIVWGACFLMLPWRNRFFVADYSLNYIWASVITMLFMAYVVYNERKGWNAYNSVFALLLAFLAAGWHEGFAVATLGGFLLLSIVRKFKFSVQWYSVGIVYAAVTLLFCICPGLIQRSREQFGVEAVGAQYYKLFFDFLPVIILIWTVILMAAVKPWRALLAEAWKNQWFVIGIGIVTVGTLLSLLFTHQPRSAFWPDLMALIMFFILTGRFWGFLYSKVYGTYVAALALGVCVVPLCCFIIPWQYRLYKESEIILTKMAASPSGTVYHDIITAKDLPLLTLKVPNHPAWVSDFHYHGIQEFTGKPFPAVLPTELDSPDIPVAAQRLEGNAGVYRVGNSLFIAGHPYPEAVTKPLRVRLVDGTTLNTLALVLPYQTKEGNDFTYLYLLSVEGKEVKGVDFL